MRLGREILVTCCLWWIQGSAIDPQSVVILVNTADHESIDLGYYYALQRDVPIENIIHLTTSQDENITWDLYLEELYNPLMVWLLEAGWLDGFDSIRKDAIGRGVRLVDSHRIGALVVCKGIPLRIESDPDRLPPKESYPKNQSHFHTNRAAVDSELAILPFPTAKVDGFFPNPLYRRTETKNLFDIKPLVVGRLDGPSYQLARELIDNAIKAEEDGIAGRAYIDLGGPHKLGDTWLENVAEIFNEQGFDVGIQPDKDRFNLVDRFDEPLFYFGWYSSAIDGPFTHYGFKFPVGAIALHIHSYSASSVRSGQKYWVGPLVARGVTVTLGNTSEPYLYLTHHPQYFVEALFKGLTAGEAALYGIPALSWAGVFIGDPLYRPPLDLTLSPKNSYDVIRTANMAKRAGDASAFKAVQEEHEAAHHFSTGLWLYHYFLELDKRDKAYEYLASTYPPSPEDPKHWGALLALSEAYLQVSHNTEALHLIDDLIDRTRSTREVRLQLLKRIIKLASKYNLTGPVGDWQEQLDSLTPPDEQPQKQ